ncbi:MAG: hypothetical protein K6E68_10295 [Lachnospiraceae bacterium]|nr:hypothetical protein [Lachnospiraceae bacterium]
MVTSIIALTVILIAIPYCIGLLPAAFIEPERRIPTIVYVMGFIFSIAIFELITVPVIVVKGDGFPLVVGLYLGVECFFAAAGLIVYNFKAHRLKAQGAPVKKEKREYTKDEMILWIFVAALVLFQMIMYVCMASFDGDDAYYVVEALLSNETDTLYRIKPYTGLTTGMDLRHALASEPIWIAFIARVTGIHSTVVAHSVIGLFLIPLVYFVYYNCGLLLFGREKKSLPIFLIFVNVLYIFGNVSIYTSATFLVTRTWQGKSMLANLVIMSVIWLLLAIYGVDREEEDRPELGYWITLFMISIGAAFCSTSSVFLIAMLIGMYGLIMAIVKKDVQIALRLMITCVPLVAYGAMYLLI